MKNPPPVNNKFFQLGQKIQRIRKSKGITQEMLAEEIGVSQNYITYIETAISKPSLKILMKIADALQVKVKDLFPF